MEKNKKDLKGSTPNLEDIPEIIEVAEKITRHINRFEVIMAARTDNLEIRVGKLEKKNSENE